MLCRHVTSNVIFKEGINLNSVERVVKSFIKISIFERVDSLIVTRTGTNGPSKRDRFRKGLYNYIYNIIGPFMKNKNEK